MKHRVGLIGWPVEHSISPAMHEAAFRATGLSDWQYELLPTPPAELPARLKSMASAGYTGANVTIPHKQAVIPLLDTISMAARGIGAVNTIVFHDRRSEGHNTDSVGFMLDLAANGIQVYQKRALVLGAGGAAHAVVTGLANRGAHVVLMARRDQQAWQLRENVRRAISRQLQIEVQAVSALAHVAATVDLIVNCTPLGMWPEVDASPWPETVPMPADVVVYDLIYRPLMTRFMARAQAAGARVLGGIGMLVQQGAAAFELWTGQQAPVSVMYKAARQALSQATE
jgi:shikimate dehydrogenase